MTLTLIASETILVRRLSKALSLADMSTETDGTNEDLQDAMSWALRNSGYPDTLAVSDIELAEVPNSLYDQFFDLSEYRQLQTILQNIDQTDERLGPHGKWGSQYPQRLMDRLKTLEDNIDNRYGINVGELEGGTVALRFQEQSRWAY